MPVRPSFEVSSLIVCAAPARDRARRRAHAEGGRVWAPGDLRRAPGPRRADRDVDQVVVDRDRRDEHVAVRDAELPEQPVVDHDVALDAAHARRRHPPRERPDAGERIRLREDRAAERVGLGVVEVRERDPARAGRAPAEGQVAARHQHEVTAQDAVRPERPAPVDRRPEPVARPERVERLGDREQLAHRAGEEQRVRAEARHERAGLEIDDPQPPRRPRVRRVGHDVEHGGRDGSLWGLAGGRRRARPERSERGRGGRGDPGRPHDAR